MYKQRLRVLFHAHFHIKGLVSKTSDSLVSCSGLEYIHLQMQHCIFYFPAKCLMWQDSSSPLWTECTTHPPSLVSVNFSWWTRVAGFVEKKLFFWWCCCCCCFFAYEKQTRPFCKTRLLCVLKRVVLYVICRTPLKWAPLNSSTFWSLELQRRL